MNEIVPICHLNIMANSHLNSGNIQNPSGLSEQVVSFFLSPLTYFTIFIKTRCIENVYFDQSCIRTLNLRIDATFITKIYLDLCGGLLDSKHWAPLEIILSWSLCATSAVETYR